MNVPCRNKKGDVITDLEIDGLPHLDASFNHNNKFYKIIEVTNKGTDKDPQYECIVVQIGKDKV